MTTITVVPIDDAAAPAGYRAVAGDKASSAPTVGQAIDALTAQLPSNGATLIVVQPMAADTFFGDVERRRLADLMARWRAARDAGWALPADEQAELDALADAELRAAADRAQALRRAAP